MANTEAEAARLEAGGIAMLALGSAGVVVTALYLAAQLKDDEPEPFMIMPVAAPKTGGIMAIARF